MRRTRWISLVMAAVLALSVAGIAVAHKSSRQAAATEAVQATFTATPDAAKSSTRTCTGVDGTYHLTKAVYNGTSTGDPRLTGNITIKAKSVVNQDTGLGWTSGKVFLRDADTGKLKAVADLTAVNTERGKLDGLLAGKVKLPAAATTPKRGRGHDHRKAHTNLLANFSAAFNAEGTELSGELGTDAPVAPTNSAIVFGQPCTSPASQYEENRHEGGRDDDRDDDRKGGRRGGRGGDDRK